MKPSNNPNARRGEAAAVTYQPIMSADIYRMTTPNAAIVMGLIAGRMMHCIKTSCGSRRNKSSHSRIYRGQPLERISETYIATQTGMTMRTVSTVIGKLIGEGLIKEYGGKAGCGRINKLVFGAPTYDREHVFGLTERALSYYRDLSEQIEGWQREHPEELDNPTPKSALPPSPAPVIQDITVASTIATVEGFEFPL